MRLGLWEPVEDPAVDPAVALAQALVHQPQQDFVRQGLAGLRSLLQLHFDRRVSLGLVAEDSLRAHVDHAEDVSDHLGHSGTARACGPDDHDLGRAARRVAAVRQTQHCVQLFEDLVLRVASDILLVDELVEDLVHGLLVDLELLQVPLSDFLSSLHSLKLEEEAVHNDLSVGL